MNHQDLSDAILILIALVLSAAVALVILKFRRRAGNVMIPSPRLGFLNLKGVAAEPLLAEDKNAIASMFSSVQVSSDAPPPCDVLLIYCDFESNGQISGTNAGFREIIRDSRALIVVVASENSGESYRPATTEKGYGYANIVLTLDRRGGVFSAFMGRLFALMIKGTSMPLAWVELAPQIPGRDHPDCPAAICLLEAG